MKQYTSQDNKKHEMGYGFNWDTGLNRILKYFFKSYSTVSYKINEHLDNQQNSTKINQNKSDFKKIKEQRLKTLPPHKI